MFVFAVATGEVCTEVGRSQSICCRPSLGARLLRTAEIYGIMSGNECNVSYVVLHVSDLRYGHMHISGMQDIVRRLSKCTCRTCTWLSSAWD